MTWRAGTLTTKGSLPTGVAPAIAAIWLAEERIPAGVYPPEAVIEPEPFFAELREAGIPTCVGDAHAIAAFRFSSSVLLLVLDSVDRPQSTSTPKSTSTRRSDRALDTHLRRCDEATLSFLRISDHCGRRLVPHNTALIE